MSKKTVSLAKLSLLAKEKAAQTPVVETQTETVTIDSQAAFGDNSGAPVPTAEAQTPAQTEAQSTAPAAAPKADANANEIVKLRLPEGSREHGVKMANKDHRWVITPNFKGRERWFDRTKIHGYGKDDKGYYVTLTRKEVAQREMLSFIEKEAAAE